MGSKEAAPRNVQDVALNTAAAGPKNALSLPCLCSRQAGYFTRVQIRERWMPSWIEDYKICKISLSASMSNKTSQEKSYDAEGGRKGERDVKEWDDPIVLLVCNRNASDNMSDWGSGHRAGSPLMIENMEKRIVYAFLHSEGTSKCIHWPACHQQAERNHWALVCTFAPRVRMTGTLRSRC